MSSEKNRNFIYKKVNINELEGIVEIHKTAFKAYFLTNLGEEFLYSYYGELLNHNETIAIGAYDQEKLCGFIVGMKNDKIVMKDFYYNNLGLLMRSILIQLFKGNKVIWRGLFARLKVAKAVFGLFVSKNVGDNSKNAISGSIAENTRLLSIAVLPQCCGTGISEGMMSFFLDSLKEDKVNAIGLSVKRENKRAISFYQKMLWQIEREEKNTLYFIKKLTVH